MTTCARCEASVPADEVVYAPDGSVQCLGCHKLAEWSAQIGRAADSAKASGVGYFSGRPPVVHPVTVCGGCNAPINYRDGQYSVKAWKATGKPKVLCRSCDQAEIDELEAIAKAEARQAAIVLGVLAALGAIGGLIYYFVFASG